MKHIRLLIISLVLSRIIFYFTEDPEGPNLLIVSVLGLIIFCVLKLLLKFIFKKSYPLTNTPGEQHD